MLWLTAAGDAAAARPIRFEQLSLEQGLSQSTVLCILQDSRGYMWFGTEDGLNRYDGNAFRTYKRDAADPHSLPNNFVWSIQEDPGGDLWIGTDGGGVVRWERSTERFVRQKLLAETQVRALRLGPDRNLWIGTRRSGLVRFDPAAGRVTRFVRDAAKPDSLGQDQVFVVHVDKKGRTWAGTDAGLSRLRTDGTGFEHFLQGTKVRALHEDHDGHLWVGTYDSGLIRLDPESGASTGFRHEPARPSSLAHDQVRAVFQDTDERLWVGTSAGLDLYEPRRGGFEHYRHDGGDATSLADDNVMSIAQDRGGVLWVGTRLGGINKWNPLGWQFGHVAANRLDPRALPNGNVTAFSEDAVGRLWVGTFGGGLHVTHRITGEVRRFTAGSTGGVSSDRITTLLHDSRGVLWVGTFDGGLNRLDPGTNGFVQYRHDKARDSSLGADGVTSLIEGDDDVLWIGTFGSGLNRLHVESGVFERVRTDATDSAPHGSERVSVLAREPEGPLWIGSFGGGLARLDPRTGRIHRYVHNADDPASLPSDSIHSLLVDAGGGLWVGTANGLAYLTKGATKFEVVTTKHGLPNDVIYGILHDRQGRLWLSTNNGLSCFDPRTRTVRNYGVSQGLQASEFNHGASYQNTRGEMFFGGINGFNAFFPERLRSIEQVPAVVLTSISKDYRPLDTPADQVRSIRLGSDEEVLIFEAAALDYSAPTRNRLSYRLDGFDRDWVALEGSRRITYTNLDPGRYTFRLRAANADGVWNEEDLAVDVQVAPPAWRTPWAYFAYACLLGALVWSVAQLQQRRLAREAEYAHLLEQRVTERTRELAERQAELERVNSELAQASVTDSLTGLANRRFLADYIEREVAVIRRRLRNTPVGRREGEHVELAFLMIDLDNFKEINDSAGHAAGDAVLKQLRDILKGACRTSDVVIRWGGDEFLVVARDLSEEQLGTLAERIRFRIASHAFDLGDGQHARSSCSIGFASFPFHPDSFEALTWEQTISVADRALYVAKASGRDTWVGLGANEKTPIRGLLAGLNGSLATLIGEGKVRVIHGLPEDRTLAIA